MNSITVGAAGRGRDADRSVAVQVIIETGLIQFHLSARPYEWD